MTTAHSEPTTAPLLRLRPDGTPALKPGEYWVQCPDGSWVVARVLNWWHATNRTKPARETE
jgi:hypothetical protein